MKTQGNALGSEDDQNPALKGRNIAFLNEILGRPCRAWTVAGTFTQGVALG